MKTLLFLLGCVLLCGCAQVGGGSGNASAVGIAKRAIAQREQWAYGGDYKVTDYVVDGKKAGWTVTVMRINDPYLPSGNKARYLGTTPVVVVIDQSGKVISYRSPFRPQ